MPHYNADAMTANEALTWHDGVNQVIAKATLNPNNSASTTVALCSLPGGAQITDMTVFSDAALSADLAYDVSVTIGGNEVANPIASATWAQVMRADANLGMGDRLTGSAVVTLSITDGPADATSTAVITAVISYLRLERGD